MDILSLIVFLPMIGALLCLFAPKQHIRTIAVVAALATFVVSLFLFGTFFGGGGDDAATVFGSHYGTLHEVERAVRRFDDRNR